MIRAFIAAAVVLLAAECERTPPEDFASRAASPVTTAAATVSPSAVPLTAVAGSDAVAANRCVRPTPDRPPPRVPPGPAPGCPVDPEPQAPKLPVVHVDLGGTTVQAELARAEHDTQRGLMYRTSMAEDHGMLFDLRVRQDHMFWMHNTCIPLDLLYVDDDGFIVGIVENAPTLNDDSRGVGCPSRWVLELNAGWSRRHGLKAGQSMTIPKDARGD